MDKEMILKQLIEEVIPETVKEGHEFPAIMNQDTPLTALTDSLNFVELVLNAETKFEITFEETELMMSSFSTIDSLAELIAQKTAELK